METAIDIPDAGAEGADEVEEGGILILSDTDSEVEEEIDEDLPPNQKRKKKRENEKLKREKRQQKEREAPPPSIHRFQNNLVHKETFGSGDFVEMKVDLPLSEACRGALIFDGFPSKGLSSAMISKFFIKALQLPLIGVIRSNLLPVVCRVSDAQPSHPLRIYGNNHVVVFTSELAIPPEISPSLVKILFHFQEQFGCEYIICTESLPQKVEVLDVDIPDEEDLTQSGLFRFVEKLADAPAVSSSSSSPSAPSPSCSPRTKTEEKEEKDAKFFSNSKATEFFGSDLTKSASGERAPIAEILYITNDQGVSDSLRKMGYFPVRNAVVGNVTGSLLAESALSECKIVCLVARHNPIMSDARASVLLVRIIAELTKASWLYDFQPLEHQVEKIEKQIKKAIKEMGKTGKKNAPSSYMYT